MDQEQLISVWRTSLNSRERSWVIFEHGTCVVLMQPKGDLAEEAQDLLREWGPVHAGTTSGDFSTITLDNGLGWVVTCHHNDILTFVGKSEVGEAPNDVSVGLLGRTRRAQDAEELHVVHVEDNRPV